MKKIKYTKLSLVYVKQFCDILLGACGCPGGSGPVASCKHMATLYYAFCSFCELGVLPDFITCTDRLSEWNKPCSKKVDPIPVSDLQAHQLAKEDDSLTIKRTPRVPCNYDPRPIQMWETNLTAVDKLRADLLSLPQPCAFLSILVPDVERALHDHTYTSKLMTDNTIGLDQETTTVHLKETIPFSQEELQIKKESMLNQLNMSPDCRNKVELYTRKQLDCVLWYQLCFPRITGSKCGHILIQKSKTIALLRSVLYCKPLDPVPLPIK